MTIEATPTTRTRILLADDHALVLAGIAAILADVPDLEIVGQVANGLEALQAAKTLAPDLVLMDLQMPKLNGLGALVAIHEQLPATKVIILTSVDDQATLFQVIRAGGSGYVLKKAAKEELLAAIRDVMAGHAFVRPPIQQMLAAETMAAAEAGDTPSGFEKLTPREKEVLGMLAHGNTNQQIADAFVISVRTVESHRANLMEKLGMRTRAELVQYALRKGYLA